MIAYLKKFYFIIRDVFLIALKVDFKTYEPYHNNVYGISLIKLIVYTIPYYLAYYSCLIVFKYIILNFLKYLISLLYYGLKLIFYFLYLWGIYLSILYIIKNYFLPLNECVLPYEQNIGTIIDITYMNIFDEKLSYLSGFFFDNFLSNFYINESYDLKLNKIIFLDLIKSKYLFFSFTLQDFFELRYLFSYGWVLDKKFDELFLLSDMFYYLWVLKYYLIWLIEFFWVFDLIFIQLKYIIWYFLSLINLWFFNLTNLDIFIKIFNFINYFFITIDDSFLIELGYSLKINIIIIIEWFFSHLLGYIAKTIKFFELASINGVMTPHKKLLFLFDDFNKHQSEEFYSQDMLLSLDIIDFFENRLLVGATAVVLLRGDFTVEGTPLMEIEFESNIQMSEFDGVEGIDNLFEEANVTSLYFSKLSFLDNYVNLNIFNKENILFEDVNINSNNVFNVLDNFVKPKLDLGTNGFFGMYGFSTLHKSAFLEPDDEEFFISDEIDEYNSDGDDYVLAFDEYQDFGYNENFYVYNLVMFYSYLLICINLFIHFSIWFLVFFVKLILYGILIYFLYYIFYFFYQIDFNNQRKRIYFFYSKINKLYESSILFSRNGLDSFWVLNSTISQVSFLEFLFKNKFQFYKRLNYIIIDIYFFLKKFLKFLVLFVYSKILFALIKFYSYILIKIKKKVKKKVLKKFYRLKFKFILLKKLIHFSSLIHFIDNFVFFIILKILKFIEYIFMFLIVLFFCNLIYLFIFILDILYNISISDFYPTYTILFILFIIMFILSGIKNFNIHILGNIGNYINNNRLFTALDDIVDYDDWEPNINTDENDDEWLADIPEGAENMIIFSEFLIGSIGSSRPDISKSNYQIFLMQRFEFFNFQNKDSINFLFEMKRVKSASLKIVYENLVELFYFTTLPRIHKFRIYYKNVYNKLIKTLFLENFIDITPDIFTDLDFFYRNEDDILFGLKIKPIKMKRYLCSVDSIEPEFEIFEDYDWYNEFFIDNLYPLSMYEENFTFLSYKSNLNNLLLLPINNSNYLINNFDNLSFFKRLGDFNPFNVDLNDEETFDDDFHDLLDLAYPMFFQENYIGFQSSYSIINLKKINKMPIMLYNVYECYDNKYKRQFYKNLAYYKKILNLKFFPYVTKYEHQKILFYLNCHSENKWNKVDIKPKKNVIIEYPFYDFIIFILISFQFFLISNNTEPFGTLFQDLDYLAEGENDIIHSYIFNEPIMSSFLIDNFIDDISNSFFEKIILIFASPGYLHENCWRFSKFSYLILYSLIFILPDNITEQCIFINTINYIDFIIFILDLWEFGYRFCLGYGLYDLLFIVF